MKLNDAIAKSLLRNVDTVKSDWPAIVQVQAGTEDALRSLAEEPDVNTTDFLHSLLSFGREFSETLFACALSDDQHASIADLLKRQNEARISKEKFITTRDFEKAAICLNTQQNTAAQIVDRLAGNTITVTVECVRTALGQMGLVGKN